MHKRLNEEAAGGKLFIVSLTETRHPTRTATTAS